MQRREFLKLSLAISGSLLLPKKSFASSVDLSSVVFNAAQFDKSRQTIIVFLAGGPSPLSANLSNIDELNQSSQQDYFSHFGSSYLNKIAGYNLWKEAGGESMQRMLDKQEMTIIRTCYSAERERVGNRAHGVCTQQNMRGNFDTNQAGVLTSLSRIMQNNGRLDSINLPFMALNGENSFYSGDPDKPLKPMALNYALANPFERNMTSSLFYTKAERAVSDYKKTLPDFDAILDVKATSKNSIGLMNNFLNSREVLENKIIDVATQRNNAQGTDKNLDAYGYTGNDLFHQSLATAIELLDSSESTRTLTLGTSGLGGWDDHSFSKASYTRRMQNLFQALEAGMKHLDGIGKKNKISIIVFGEFGRNVNLNASFGWDHGNLQNVFMLGGTDYLNHVGGSDAIVGETMVDNGGRPKSGRLWLKPKTGSYACEPLCVAATIYAMHGISNPENLTGGYGVINPTIKGQAFLKDGISG